ncbi:MAG: carboxypeptidase regulatory-like domain-containing protein, partial [Sulfuricurvum sp.]|nr:carboxypeptidase regulatory-like domain-containing protein [Sulfuricurvum sp.]
MFVHNHNLQNEPKRFGWVSATKMAVAGVLSTLLLVGCGGGGGDDKASSTNVPTLSYTVNVADDPIVGARVSAPECAKFIDNENGSYILQECIAKPSTITAVGGSFDMNGATIYQTAPLILKTSQLDGNASFVVTPLTTLASQEDNLSALASALGISEADLFLDRTEHRAKMREINAILNAARSAGITKYEAFVAEFKNQIKNGHGISAAKKYMIDNLETYRNKFGVVFGGFISDLNDTTPTVTTGKVRLGGFVYDAAIPNATITILDGNRTVATGTSDSNGRYSIEIDATELETSKVLKFQAVSGTTRLIAYVTTDELKAGNIGYRISSGTVEDLVISNVTTAKAVLVDKIDPLAKSNATSMVEVKLIVESMYATDILNIASSIKAVVDYNASMNQSDTLALAQAIAAEEQDANTSYTDEVRRDPILSDQLNSTTPN